MRRAVFYISISAVVGLVFLIVFCAVYFSIFGHVLIFSFNLRLQKSIIIIHKLINYYITVLCEFVRAVLWFKKIPMRAGTVKTFMYQYSGIG